MIAGQGGQMAASKSERRDVVVGGAGFAGLALAIALRQALGEGFAVTVADPALAAVPSKDPRATAIAAAARRLFEAIGAWQAVEDEAQPMLDMVITDSKLEDAVRPTFLTFGGEVEEGEPFAHMIENRLLIDALVAKAKEAGIDLRPTAVCKLREYRERHRGDARRRRAARSPAAGRRRRRPLGIREQAGIESYGWNYDQSGIVCTVAHERDHARPRRGAFPARRAVRHPAAHGQSLVDRVDGKRARGRAPGGAARRRIPRGTGAALRT